MEETTTEQMSAMLERQRSAQTGRPSPTAAERIEWIDRCIGLLVDHADSLVDAMAEDFGSRSRRQGLFTDIAGSIGPLKHARASLKGWMRPQRRKVTFPLGMLGASAEVRFQPKGVVGVISPWNFPVNLTFAPLAGVLAAGNRAMIKPSEFTPRTSQVMKSLFETAFPDEIVTVATGGPEVGSAFCAMPFDHILFTGATSVGRNVMRAAAENLTPVTLELGGKSPVIVGRSADMDKTAARIMFGKTLNAGQICLAPDYVFAPSEQRDAFVDAARLAVDDMYADLKENDDYTSVINQRHHERLKNYLDDAQAKGATLVELNPDNEDFVQQSSWKIAPTLVLDPTDDMLVMQDEIFGPILPVKTYREVDEAIAHVNANDRPLALYYFGEDPMEREHVIETTISGGVTVNDVVFHVSVEDLPFGGTGPSGMGAYHGREGFLEFSHARSVYTQSPLEKVSGAVRPPYGPAFAKLVADRIKR